MHKNNHYGYIVQSLTKSQEKSTDSLTAHVTNYSVWEEH